MKDFIETRIITAVRELLSGKINELLQKSQFTVPMIETDNYGYANSIVPVITFASCEQTEKERIIRLEAYTVTMTFVIPDSIESELYCYAYSGATSRALYDNPTLSGAVNRVTIVGKKYQPPKAKNCGDDWILTITLQLTIEGIAK